MTAAAAPLVHCLPFQPTTLRFKTRWSCSLKLVHSLRETPISERSTRLALFASDLHPLVAQTRTHLAIVLELRLPPLDHVGGDVVPGQHGPRSGQHLGLVGAVEKINGEGKEDRSAVRYVRVHYVRTYVRTRAHTIQYITVHVRAYHGTVVVVVSSR